MKVFLVGGCVRDKLLGLAPNDIDYVVINSSEQEMLDKGFIKVGKSFPVFHHPENGYEYALARKEQKTGSGYNGFITEVNNVSLEDDLSRRDLTINAMAMTENGEIIDPFGGKQDLENKILRHVSNAFVEDPVRVLRVARFSARYNFKVANETNELLKDIVAAGEVNTLTAERIWKELEKTSNEKYINNFFDVLEQCGALNEVFGISSIDLSDKKLFENIKKLENSNDLILVYLTSLMPEKNKNALKMPASVYSKQKILNLFKNKPYSDIDSNEKIKFIHATKAMQDATSAEQIIIMLSLIHNKNIVKEIEQLRKEVSLLNNIEYVALVEKLKLEKKNIKEGVWQLQKEIIENQSNKSNKLKM